ncbi:M56 family metallopeptidase [Paenibacillus piri]|uniref:M56 family metallopeptidase n=1 Tax=Paenibacillus piri TaxID=2547395 RepID=A0A4R5KIU7_9BACL|nr:M56 family metallopeptidase [Paenibacillus piri]TDF95449.1 M56 family metallopeptidase [Paenibacillus piri]
MTSFFFSLLIATLVGTIMWALQNSIKSITQNVFSQAWHYYTGLIPVFFLLGGTEIVGRLSTLIRSVVPDSRTIADSGSMAEPYVRIAPIEPTAASALIISKRWFDSLLRLDHLNEIVLGAVIVWAIGTAVFLAIHIKMYRAFKRSILQESRVCDPIRQCPVKVVVSHNATTPMVIGLWKPMIVLPDTPMGEKELAMILSHELVHIKRGDVLVKLLVFMANAVHWFNPAAYMLNRQMNTLCELSCDEKVVQEMDMENRRFYGETLLSMLEYGVKRRNVVFVSSLCNSKKSMKRRLVNLMNAKKINKSVMMLSLAATISMVGIGGFVASAAESAMPDRAAATKIPTGKEPQGRNVYVQLEDGTVFYYDKDGNKSEVPEMRKSLSPPEYTTEELVDHIKQWVKDESPVAQEHVDKLPQKYVDEINEAYGLQLKRTVSLTVEELVELTKKGIENNAVPQAYVDALPQQELDAINKTYGWELRKSK